MNTFIGKQTAAQHIRNSLCPSTLPFQKKGRKKKPKTNLAQGCLKQFEIPWDIQPYARQHGHNW
jgi:hypothetical protein